MIFRVLSRKVIIESGSVGPVLVLLAARHSFTLAHDLKLPSQECNRIEGVASGNGINKLTSRSHNIPECSLKIDLIASFALLLWVLLLVGVASAQSAAKKKLWS